MTLPSRSAVDRAGAILRSAPSVTEDYKGAFETVALWRSCFAVPLQRMNMLVRQRRLQPAIVAQRLKRMSSIIDKLKRYGDMQVTRMQDIGGLRVVFDDLEQVYAFSNEMENRDSGSFSFIRMKDYVNEPKKSGYRGIHQIFKFNNEDYPESNGRLIEMQIRTRLQHLWATSVESLDIILNSALKTGRENAPHARYMQLASALFALKEGQQPHKEFVNVPLREIVEEIGKEGAQFDCYLRDNIDDALIAGTPGKDDAYTLLSRDILNGTPHVTLWPSFKGAETKAVRRYASVEADSKDDDDAFVVLVCAGGTMKELEEAYPNYFLRLHTFKDELSRICAGLVD